MTLHFSHIGLTDALTFIGDPRSSVRRACGPRTPPPGDLERPLLEPVRDPASAEVVGRQLHLDLVAGQDADVVHAHLAGDMGEHFVVVVEVDPEHRVGQSLDHFAFYLDGFFFVRHTPYSSTDSGLIYYHKRLVPQNKSSAAARRPSGRALSPDYSCAPPLSQRRRVSTRGAFLPTATAVSYTHLRAHETRHDLVCRLLLEKK